MARVEQIFDNVNVCSYYQIGGCSFKVCGEELSNAIEKLCGFHTFKADSTQTPDFTVSMPLGFKIPETQKILYTSETDGVTFYFYSIGNNAHLLELEHGSGSKLYAWNNPDAKQIYLKGVLLPQMLRFALWVAYGLMTMGLRRIAIHGSCIVKDNRAYLFLGESGTGKSTHTRLWRENIPGAELLNDDSPIVAADIEDGKIWIYGSPWSGKTPCYKQERYRLCGCVRLSQAPENIMTKLPKLKAYAALHPSCPPEFAYDDFLYDMLGKTINDILLQVPFYHLKCLPNPEAAQLSYNTLAENGE